MIAFFGDLFDTSGFPPRWQCGQWSGPHGWLHILSDIAIFGAYAAIPLALAYFIRRRKDVPFIPIFWLFAAFIISCGVTHLIEATIFWHPWYRLSGLMKAVTALVSWTTVIALFKVIPVALALPGQAKINLQLSKEIAERRRGEEALRESEERLKLAAEAGRVGIWDWNLVNDTLVWDDAMFSLYGTRRENFSGTYAAWAALLHPEDRAASETAVQEALAGRKDYPIQFRAIWPDGSVHYLEAHGRVFRNEAGQAVRMVGTNMDITARRLRERNLVFLSDMQKIFAPLTSSTEIMHAASERIAEHLGLIHCTLVEVDEPADTCTVLYDHNAPGTRNLAGDYRLSDFLPEEERRELMSGAPLVITNVRDGGRTAERAEHFEALGIRALVNAGYVSRGRWRFVLHASRAEPYAWPAEEVEVLTELAARVYVRVERARAEEALRESNTLLDTLLKRAPIGFCMLDRELRYVRINDQLAGFNGIPAAAHLGRTVAEIVPNLEATVRTVTERILQTGEAVSNHEFCGETAAKPGMKRYWKESWYPVRDGEGKIIGFGAVVEDITARKQSEEAVARLAAIVESSHDALFGEDLEGIITSWNQGAEQIFGYRAEEIVGTSIMRLVPANRQAAELELQRQIVAGEKGGTFETIRLNKDGREFPASITIAPLKDAAGKVIGTSRVVRDITERTRAEEALRGNAALFSTLIAQAPMGTYVVDAQFRIQKVNAQAMPVFATVQPLIGRDFKEVVEILWGSDVGEQVLRVFRNTLETGERYISPPFTEQRHDLGIEQTYEWETQRVVLPDGLYGVVCYFHEVTESARATAALRASQDRMRLAAEATGVGIWEWNVLTDTIRWDAQLFRIYGIEPTPDGLVHYCDWSGAVLPEDLAENEAILQDTVRRAGQSSREFRIRRRSDGECRHIRAVETVRKNVAGQTEWVVGTNLDITERKAANLALRAAKDAAEQANASKDRFLAILSHELRTPLNPVLMAVAALENDPGLRPEVREDLAMIRRNVELETRLIDDLLDLSRITSGKVALKSQAVELNEAVLHVCGICHPQLLEKNIRLETDLGGHVGSVFADPARLRQILWNVLKNAVKFTPASGSVRVRTARLGPDRCEVRVEDNGIGIPANVLPRIFEAFEQGEAHITQQFGGLGLGLAITRALVELQGGTIRAESAGLGQGATFTIELPGQPAPPVTAPPPDGAGAPAAGAPLRVLLVEDHADTARTLARLLRRAGFEVITAADVAGALSAAEREAPDLLVSDLGLPDGTGHELMRAVRTRRPLPGIAMSGYGMKEDLNRSLEAGFAEHLVKPVTMPDLIAAIRRVAGTKADVATTNQSRRYPPAKGKADVSEV